MPSPLRRPSRSVRVPGRVSRPVRLGHQSTGSLFMPDRERPHADEEMPQSPQGPVIPPRRPEDVSPADPRPADTGSDDAAEAEANSAEAEANSAEASPPD